MLSLHELDGHDPTLDRDPQCPYHPLISKGVDGESDMTSTDSIVNSGVHDPRRLQGGRR